MFCLFLVLSVSRALGIPCRVVTNFLSAHDTNSNLTIERYIDENGELIQSRDMIWLDIFEPMRSWYIQKKKLIFLQLEPMSAKGWLLHFHCLLAKIRIQSDVHILRVALLKSHRSLADSAPQSAFGSLIKSVFLWLQLFGSTWKASNT